MAIKELLSKLVDQQLIEGYQVENKQNNEWQKVRCQLITEREMIIIKLTGDEVKEEFQRQISKYWSAPELRIVAYYTSERRKIRDWVESIEADDKQSLLVVCLNQAKEEKFITQLQKII